MEMKEQLDQLHLNHKEKKIISFKCLGENFTFARSALVKFSVHSSRNQGRGHLLQGRVEVLGLGRDAAMGGERLGIAELEGRKLLALAEDDDGLGIDVLDHAEILEQGHAALPALVIHQHAVEGAEAAAREDGGQVEGLEIVGRGGQEILQMLADGMQTEAVAIKLGLSTETVRTHTKRILAKLGADTRTQAVAIGIRTGLIE